MLVQKSVNVAATPDTCWKVLTSPEHQKHWLPEVLDTIPDDPAKPDGPGASSKSSGTRLDYEAEMEMKGLFLLLAPLFKLVSRGKVGGTLSRFAQAAASA